MNNSEIINEKMPIAAEKLSQIFLANQDKRICVVGSSCVGKTTLLEYLPEATDMDDLLFGRETKGRMPMLSPEEIAYVCGPWTPEVGQFMTKKARELIKIEPGHPVFGTIVFPSDLVVEVTVPDDLLRERIRRRGADASDVFEMKAQIEMEIEQSGIEKMVVENI